MESNTAILRNVSRLLLPLIQVFAFYVILFGHLSPGGGFAGGSILGASLLMKRFVFKESADIPIMQSRVLLPVACICLILYGLLKGFVFVMAFFSHHNFAPVGNPGHFLSGGFILPLNFLVGLTVAITFYLIIVLLEEGQLP